MVVVERWNRLPKLQSQGSEVTYDIILVFLPLDQRRISCCELATYVSRYTRSKPLEQEREPA